MLPVMPACPLWWMARWAARMLTSLAVAAGLALGAAAPAEAALSPVLSASCVTNPADTPSASDAVRHGRAAGTRPDPLGAVARVPFQADPESRAGAVGLAAPTRDLTSGDPFAAGVVAAGSATPVHTAAEGRALPAGAAPADVPAPVAAVVAAPADGLPAGPTLGVLGSRAPPVG